MAFKGSWKKKRRQEWIEERKEHYIFCEGKCTEPNYFGSFRSLICSDPIYRGMITIEIFSCQKSTLGILEEAVKYIKNKKLVEADVWCVYDKDDFLAKDFDEVNRKTDELNKRGAKIKYHAIWSNECFEFWLLLHFANYRSDSGRKAYFSFLNDKFKKLGIGGYQKNYKEIFDILLSNGDPKRAISYAKNIIKEIGTKVPSKIVPGTKVYELVETLASYLPEDYKKKFI